MGVFSTDQNPVALFGVDARKQVGIELKKLNVSRAMVFADAFMVDNGKAEELAGYIREAGIEALIYKAEVGEPTSSFCDNAADFARENKVDGMVGLGGGATMDTAKIACKLVANGGKTDDYLGYANTAGNHPIMPLLLLTTTSGTGSEVSVRAAVESDAGVKGAINQGGTMAIVDPTYTYTVPPVITANTGIDALTHAVECLFNCENVEHLMADMYAKESIKLIFQNLLIAYVDGSNEAARVNLSYASMLAGFCLHLRKLTYGHSAGNQISSKLHCPHGVSVGATLPSVIRYGVKNIPAFTTHLCECLGVRNNAAAPDILIKMFDELQKNVKMKNMKELGIEREFIEGMVEEIKKDSKWKVMTPPDFDKMKESLYEAWDY